jgi:hypothetical protein
MYGDGARILQVTPTAPGRSRLRCFEFSSARATATRSRRGGGPRRRPAWLKGQIALAESTQAGLQAAVDATPEAGPVAPALARFRAQIAAVLHALPQGPGER